MLWLNHLKKQNKDAHPSVFVIVFREEEDLLAFYQSSFMDHLREFTVISHGEPVTPVLSNGRSNEKIIVLVAVRGSKERFELPESSSTKVIYSFLPVSSDEMLRFHCGAKDFDDDGSVR